MAATIQAAPSAPARAPHPGSQAMPQWNVAELPDAPVFQAKNLWHFLGPGLLMGGAAIGGGEWLLGPKVTAIYGGGLLWLATLSILGQVLYNIEISRYTLYTGEPIFTGKCRTLPGPMLWVAVYLALDFGTVFPYLAASAATPLVTMYLGKIPDPVEHGWMLRGLSLVIFLLSLLPMIFGGKVYNSLKAVMTFKIVFVMGFLLVLAFFYSHASTWIEIFSGFFKFGQMPIDKEGNLDNLFLSLWEGRGIPAIDLSMAAFLSGMIAISGQGGLSNTPISNYTRDQGWGMGSHVGAIPSLVGGQNIQLSHVGTVFVPDNVSLPRWKHWYQHVVRDQAFVWAPACFFGLALPSMLSVEFLKRGSVPGSDWAISVMTADGVRDRAQGEIGQFLWYMTLFCGFVVLAPSMASTVDGFVRRWVDVFWTASKRLHSLEPAKIKNVYFAVLSCYALFAIIMLAFVPSPATLIKIATSIYNFALGFSCWHVVVLNSVLLPKPLRPNWAVRIGLTIVGIFFWCVATVAAYKLMQDLGVIAVKATAG